MKTNHPMQTDYDYPGCPICGALLSDLLDKKDLAEEEGRVTVTCTVCGNVIEARLPYKGRYWLVYPFVSRRGRKNTKRRKRT